MARTDELSRRAERLLGGGVNTGDLHALFLWLRDRSFGNKAVADVGDFVAHSDERDQGIAHRGAQNFFKSASYLLPRVGGKRPPCDLKELKEATWSAFDLADAAEVRRKTGVGKNKVKKLLSSAFEAIAAFDGKHLTVYRDLTRPEGEMLKAFSSLLVSKPAFTSQELVQQFLACLVKNRLIADMPRQVPPRFAAIVGLYAAERMHLSQVLLSDGTVAELQAAIGNADGKEHIEVHATAPVRMDDGFELPLAFPIHMTDLDPWEWCEAELLPEHPFMGSDWNFPLEIGPAGKLQKL